MTYKGHVIKRTPKGEYDIYLRGQKVAHGSPLSGAKFWVDRYAEKSNAGKRRKNPTKAQKRTRAAISRKKTAIVKAVKSLLKKANPSAKITGASVVKLKGGVLKITPIKANPRSMFSTKDEAERFARHIGRHQGAKVVKKGAGYAVVWTKRGYQK